MLLIAALNGRRPRSALGTVPILPAELASGAPIPTPSYTQQLLCDRNLRLKKLGEEATELAVACADGDAPRAREEAADLFYHLLVAIRPLGLDLSDLAKALNDRRR